MTETDDKKTHRVTKAALQTFIAEQEDEHDWHVTGPPKVWDAIRNFAGMPPLTRDGLLERKIEQMTRILNEETDPAAKRQHRAGLMEMLTLMREREDRAREKERVSPTESTS